jgi:hypothetical protein
VFGVPTLAVDDQLFWGDDRLEDAAAFCGRSPAAPTRAIGCVGRLGEQSTQT